MSTCNQYRNIYIVYMLYFALSSKPRVISMCTIHISCAQYLHVAHGFYIRKHSSVAKVSLVCYPFKSQVVYSTECDMGVNTLDQTKVSQPQQY